MISLVSIKVDNDVFEAVESVLKSGQLAEGPAVKQFEEQFSEFCTTSHAIAVTNGTTALHTALLAAGVMPGDEVITTPFSFIATGNAILYCNAVPVFADIDPSTFTIIPTEIEKKITAKTKAVVIVHLYGLPCDLDAIMDICNRHGLSLIEDACQAHGATFNGKKVGSFGTGCFSFYATKNLMVGEGGMITTNDEVTDSACRKLRNHGRSGPYLHDTLGFNYRMTDISAAIGICNLKKLEDHNRRRNENAAFLSEEIGKIKGLVAPVIPADRTHVFHQYTIRVKPDFGMGRDKLQTRLKEQEIGSAVIYPIPIHQQPLYQDLGYSASLPNSELAATEVLSLPVHHHLSEDDLKAIIQGLKNA